MGSYNVLALFLHQHSILNVPWLQERVFTECWDCLLMDLYQEFPTYSEGHDVLTFPSLPLSLLSSPLTHTLTASSQLLASPKINLTSEGRLLKCLLNVCLSPTASIRYQFFILSQSSILVLSCVNMCAV